MSGFDWWEYCQKWRTPEVLEAIGEFYSTDYFDFVHDFLVFGTGSYAGKPFQFAEFQVDMLGELLYTIGDDGLRVKREAGWWFPRKNGKSEQCSALGLHELCCSKEKANVILAGGTLEDTNIIYDCCQYMISKNATLSSRLKIQKTKRSIVNRSTFSLLEAVATNKDGKHGKNPSLVIGDELHTWMYREMWTSLTTGSDTRPQPLFIRITTSGENDPEHLETEEYQYAQEVADDPEKDPGYQAILFVADKDKDNWLDEEVWRRCNPGIGAGFKSIDGMRRMAKKGESNPRIKNDFCRLQLNMRLGAIAKWIDMSQWDGCESGDPIPAGAWVFGGLDLASTTDIASWVKYDGRSRFEWKYYIPRERMKAIEKRDRVPYSVWLEHEWLTVTDGSVIDYEVIKQDIFQDQQDYDLKFVGYDPWNAAAMRLDLEAKGVEMLEIRQGVSSLSAPCKEFEAMIISGQMDHGGNPISRHHASNVEVFTDSNGNIKPVRPKHGASGKKIDGMVAAVMAKAVSLGNEPPAGNLASEFGPITLDHDSGEVVM